MTLNPWRWWIWIWLVMAGSLAALPASEITVDLASSNGLIRPLHGVNLGPLCYRGTVDLSAYHREIAVPLTRLHDVVWVNADAVDVSTIFRDPRNDPAQPESYDFATTDDYVQSILNVGSKIVYRLGESIEHTPRKYRVHPPSDPEKWAQVCLGIIRHYNDGWNRGFQHNIRYWEIWNEPDVRPAMWTGTDAQYFALYTITAKTIKARFPQVKVGGPALGGTGDFKDDRFVPGAFFTNFLAYCRAQAAPLDFFSWHRYTANPWDLPRRAQAIRQVLDEYGFTQTASHLNEWNYLPREDWRPMLKEGQGLMRQRWYDEMGGPSGAAFAAAGLLLLQDAPLDAANYYTGEIQGFGLFSYQGVPKKTFYAFKAFKWLLETPLRVPLSGGQPERLAAVAGVNSERSEIGILVSNFAAPDDTIDLKFNGLSGTGPVTCRIYVIDETHDLELINTVPLPAGNHTLSLALKAPSVAFVRLQPNPK